METKFWEYMATQGELAAFQGTYARKNDFRADWVNTFDLRISQELPGFFKATSPSCGWTSRTSATC